MNAENENGAVGDGAVAMQGAAATDGGGGADVEAVQELKQELAKWQERVPKLAAALRERTEHADQLQAEVENLRNAGSSTSVGNAEVGIQAREQLIDELEAKLKALNSKHQDLQGQLHSRDMEISDLRQDVGAWKDKWQAVTTSLDEQGSLASTRDDVLQQMEGDFAELKAALEAQTRIVEDRDHELETLRDETASLNDRNAKLFETTELANRQIETLGENLTQLRDQVREKDGGLQGAAGELESLRERLAGHDDQLRSRDADMEAMQERLEGKTEEVNALKAGQADHDELVAERDRLQQQLGNVQQQDQGREQDLEMLHQRIETIQEEAGGLKSQVTESEEQLAGKDAEIAKLTESQGELQSEARKLQERLAEELSEVERLDQCIANADQTTNDRQDERRQLSEQLSGLKERNEHLEAQLNERSNLVMGLEQDKASTDNATQELGKENERLSDALAKAERHASEHAEHITQLDSRLERQKDHMLELEEELAQSQEQYLTVQKDRSRTLADKEKQISELKEELEVSSTMVEDVKPANDAAHDELVAKMQKLEEQLEKRTEATAKADEAVRELEDKLAKARAAAESKAGDPGGEEELLQEEVHKLEQMVRDRTEQLNKMQWQQNMTERSEAVNIDGDNKMLIVLNQQLADARESNDRLVTQVRELEAQLADNSPAMTADDLTVIRGIGPKVAGQLVELGIASYLQIAELEEEDLADEAHVLYAFKKRIEKDGWVDQARGLLQG